jgi:hypothetical protein
VNTRGLTYGRRPILLWTQVLRHLDGHHREHNEQYEKRSVNGDLIHWGCGTTALPRAQRKQLWTPVPLSNYSGVKFIGSAYPELDYRAIF